MVQLVLRFLWGLPVLLHELVWQVTGYVIVAQVDDDGSLLMFGLDRGDSYVCRG